MARVQAGEIIQNLKTDGNQLVQDNIALAKAELQPMAKHAGIGGGLFGGAGYLALNAVSLLFVAGGFGLSLIFSNGLEWKAIPSLTLGFALMAIVLLIMAGIFALIGKGQMGKLGLPKKTIEEAKATVDTLKASFERGKNGVTADINDRGALSRAKRAADDLDEVR